MHYRILGTAGHIDHGKSALVKALTGIDPDRLKEEKERGITIDLGFADLRYPDGLTVGIVDVPGHERLIRNMLAGASGIDMVLLVIDADEGVMPQSREHLHICNLLGIKTGIIAITKVDIVDDEWLDLVKEDVRAFVAGSFLENAQIVPVSSKTMLNIDILKDKIRAVAFTVDPKSVKGIFRLPIDRVFTLKGFGTVVTGTAVSGFISLNDEVNILPSNIKSKVRGLHSHGKSIEKACAGQRVAINLQGVEKEALKRGDAVVMPGRFIPSAVIDAKLKLLPNAPELKNRDIVHLHIGTTENMARVILYEKKKMAPGESWYCQFRLQEPVIVMSGDRFIIRRFSPLDTIGGGVVLDSTSYKMSHRKNLESLPVLERGSLTEKIEAKVMRSGIQGISAPFIEGWIHADIPVIHNAITELRKNGSILMNGDLLMHKNIFHRIGELAKSALIYFHKRNPLKAGMPKEELRSCLNMQPKFFDFIVAKLPELIIERDIARLSSFNTLLSQEDNELKNRVLAIIEKAGCRPPLREEICRSLLIEPGKSSDIMKILTKQGLLIRINDSLYLASSVFKKIVEQLKLFFGTKSGMTVKEFKQCCGVGSKYAIHFLNYLDFVQVTRRVGDIRILLKNETEQEEYITEHVLH
ncbi:MAG: selenocysteine-specific translation elongation factor [Thermodesulfovibrionales bacterium]|nr:selenocysteine-specific translation elongation factor [Thermodesulfovibrionales bacterium]